MTERHQLEGVLAKKGLILAGPTVNNPDEPSRHFAFVKVHVDRDGKRTPSAFRLNKISEELAASGIILSFVLVDGERENLDSSLKTMLFGKFPEYVRNSFAKFENNEADVWIEPKRSLTEEEKQGVSNALSQFLELLNYRVGTLNYTQESYLPTPTAILRAIKILAPCSVPLLQAELRKRHFDVPNDMWLNHSLDKLRKSGSIVRTKSGDYFLSLRGLNHVGTRKSRKSPDIARALDLARRGT